MNKACVIGWGTVGRATASAFGIDKFYSRSESNITLEEAGKFKYVFICLPTPTVNGKCDTSAIEETIKEILSYGSESIFIIRSTVYPGFNRFLQSTFGIDRFVSNPEFLSEDTAMEDAKHPDLVVVGSDNTDHAKSVLAFYSARYKYFNTYLTDSVTAELIKYSLNTFFATKVVFANEIYDYAQDVKANYDVIRQVIEKHPWGSKNHFRVWDKGGRGAAGKCLSKDLEAIVIPSGSVFFQAAHVTNQRLLKEYPKNG